MKILSFITSEIPKIFSIYCWYSEFGAGAKILKQAYIGDHAKIGANAVVICDVPPGATAVGIPARIIPAKNLDSSDHSPQMLEDSEDLQ